MAITEAEMDNSLTEVNKQDIAKVLEEKGAIINEVGDGYMIGEYGDYEFEVDKDNKVTIGGMLTGVKPDATIIPLDTEEGIESARIQVIATITEGEIASVESRIFASRNRRHKQKRKSKGKS